MPLDISDHERAATAALIERLAANDRRLAEHSLACGALSAMLARMLECPAHLVARAAILGSIHECGRLASGIVPAEPSMADLRALRERTISVIHAVPALAHYAPLAAMTFDDVVPAIEAKIVIVADVYDALLRQMPGVAGASRRAALDVLEALVGPRVDGDVVHALIFSQRREPRLALVSA